MNVDPLAESFPNWNPYNYCMQDPINLIDPTGMSPEGGEGDPPSMNGTSFFNGMIYTEGKNSWERVTGGWTAISGDAVSIVDTVIVANKPTGDTVSQRVPNAWEILRDDSILGGMIYQAINALTVVPQMCMFRSVSGGTMKSLDDKAMSSEAALMGFVSTGISFFGTQVAAMKAAANGVTTPKGWTSQPSKKGGGTVFKDPNNPHNIIRQMPGNPKSPNILQQKPYVKFMKEGKFYDAKGNLLKNGDLPEAHIPLSEFNINKMPKF